jgi:hypothetical protein
MYMQKKGINAKKKMKKYIITEGSATRLEKRIFVYNMNRLTLFFFDLIAEIMLYKVKQ